MREIKLPTTFEEFDDNRKQGFIHVKNMKEEGKKFIGVYCTFFPKEITEALDIGCVSLCSFSNETIPYAEQDLPANLCPLIKSSYGFGKADKCPYFYFSDLVVGETTCDGKKKMYELMSEFKDVYVMQLPNSNSENSKILWREEIIKLTRCLEEKFDVKMDEEHLKDVIHGYNEYRRALLKYNELQKLDPAPLSSGELFSVIGGAYYDHSNQSVPATVDRMIEETLARYKENPPRRKARILVTGCPIGEATYKIIDSIENNDGVVVTFENCGGIKTLVKPVDEALDPYDGLADKYLSIGCSCMTPNDNRMNLLSDVIDEYNVEGVIEMVLHACHTYSVETKRVSNLCKEKGIPYMSLETDYSDVDVAQINTRIGAFIEML